MRYRTRAGRLRSGPLVMTVAAATVMAALPAVAPMANAAVACTVNYAVSNDWGSGFVADVTIKNEGDQINGWTLTWTFADGQQVSNLWNGGFTQSGGKMTVTPVDWNK